ncbi:unnamed protein product [Mytilus coruscus]|uniref:EGF-like domain-containing protein n=1 Tax=Mytilus coruscus TaxID=42192 RepID=A0A6J8CQP1_MYTCO|nr:unnamed protein product [Mytilus coruscus]
MDLLARFVGIWMVFVIYMAVGVEGAAYGEACTGAGAGDCSEANNVCDTTCKCATNFFRKTSPAECAAQVAALDGVCDTAQTASDQCAVADSECRTDSGSDKCLCKATHYTDGAACTIRKNPDIACSATGECVTNAECDVGGTDKCECNAGYNETPTVSPTMCSGVVKFATLPYMYVVPIIVSMMFLLR